MMQKHDHKSPLIWRKGRNRKALSPSGRPSIILFYATRLFDAFVGLVNLSKLGFGILAHFVAQMLHFVGMIFHGKPAIGLSHLVIGGAAVQAQADYC